ncbi:MAG: hypothetical protein J6J35_04740 [Alphaproteobacteria bacterium]|nr:hypothetical protein [Alphaproteobacteria bacterium]
MAKKINADKTEYIFTDEKGNELTYQLNCPYNRDYPEPYNITLHFTPCWNFESPSWNEEKDKKLLKDAKDYFAAHPEVKGGEFDSQILCNYIMIQAQNHICDKVLNGTANSWEQAFAEGMCTQPTFMRGCGNLPLGTSIMVSEDILNGKEPFANAVKHEEETTGKKVSRNVDKWTTYPRKEELIKYVASQNTKAEMKEQTGEEITNPKATAQGYRIDKKYNKPQEQGHEPKITSKDKAYTGEEVNALIRDLIAKKSREM